MKKYISLLLCIAILMVNIPSFSFAETSEELTVAQEMGFGETQDLGKIITADEYMAMLDRFVEIASPEKAQTWKNKLPLMRGNTRQMTISDGILALFYAVETIGEPYLFLGDGWAELHKTIGDEEMSKYSPNPDLFGEFWEEHSVLEESWGIDATAYFYTLGMYTSNDTMLFDYDTEGKSLHTDSLFTKEDALSSVIRLLSFREKKDIQYSLATYKDEELFDRNNDIISNELLEKANSLSPITIDNYPTMSGMALLGGDKAKDFVENWIHDYDIRNIAEWGFDNVRLLLKYNLFFSEDMSQVCFDAVEHLDKLVACAIESGIHIEFYFELPGWWTEMDAETFRYRGDLDFFTNPEHRTQAIRFYRMIAMRYRDIPNSVLTYNLFVEPWNWTRSTGNDIRSEASEAPEEIVSCLMELYDAILAADSDRIIGVEVASVGDSLASRTDLLKQEVLKRGGLLNLNFAVNPFIYTTFQGTDDRVESHDLVNWPLIRYYNQPRIACNASKPKFSTPLEFNGALFKDTVFELNIREIVGSGTLHVMADDQEIYVEVLRPAEDPLATSAGDDVYTYETEAPVDQNDPYAKSAKQIIFSLPDDTKQLLLYVESDSYMHLHCSEIDVTFPEKYTADRFFMISNYDATQEDSQWYGYKPGITTRKVSTIVIGDSGTDVLDKDGAWLHAMQVPITINADCTYSTPSIKEQYDKAWIEKWIETNLGDLGDTPVQIRFERQFNGASGPAIEAYYRDLLSVLRERGISWISNDFEDIARQYSQTLAGHEIVEYKEYGAFDHRLLAVLQEFN